MSRSEPGWTWFEPPVPPAPEDPGLALARMAARLFLSADGDAVLDHLRALTLGRCLGPESSDAALRHLEGQRALVLHISSLIARGQAGA